MKATVFDDRICKLGEGPLWHPVRQQLFWFDILGKRLLSAKDGAQLEWRFEEHVSAAGWVDLDTLLVASETGLYRFHLGDGARTRICELEADNRATRSNDGRADPWGGFWIGTMGKNAEPKAGAIYRFFNGELRRLFSEITVSNAICFSPDRSFAYFADTEDQRLMRQPLAAEDGWPKGPAETLIDFRQDGLRPDGAVVDTEGCIWNAQWGAGRVARYAPDGAFLSAVDVPASQTSCPAFGGPGLRTLFVTTAAIGKRSETQAGLTFAAAAPVAGRPENQVLIE